MVLFASDRAFTPKSAFDQPFCVNNASRTQTESTVSPCLARYNFCVARGWESKSVEEQQSQAISTPRPAKPALTPAQIVGQRRRHGLMLSRQHVLQQLEAAQNPRHREILQSALAELDAQLGQPV